MPNFSYSATSSDGHPLTGTLSAPNRTAVLETLHNQGAKPLVIKEVKGKSGTKFSLGKKKVKLHDLVVFTRELSTMISAGVSLPRGLSTLADQAENKYFKEVITSINHDVEAGTTLADSLDKFPNVFNEVYVNMVRAGEAGGILDEILKRLATQVEKEATMRKKIRSAMAYPVVIMSITVLAFFGIMIFVLPKIGKIITDLGGPDAKLPFYSQIMLDMSKIMQKNAVLILIITVVGSIAFRRYIKTEDGKFNWHKLLLRLPIIGKIIAKIAIARFARTFASLMTAGVTVLDSLEITGKAVGNKVIQKELVKVAEAVRNGQPLGKQLMAASYFPPIVGQMMSVGEETGKIGEIIIKVADFYDEEVDTLIDGLASIIEPIMIVVLGGLVGIIAASVMGPIASLSQNIGG